MIPEEMQDLGRDGEVTDVSFWRRKARTITVPETAMAVAKTTLLEFKIEDMTMKKKKSR